MFAAVVPVSSVMAPSVFHTGRCIAAQRCGRVRPVRVAVVAGPDPGHSFPAIALCQRFGEAGDDATLFTGEEWLETAGAAGVDVARLDGLVATDEDLDAGARIHRRAARVALPQRPAPR